MAAESDSPKVNPLEYMSRTEWYGNESTPALRWLGDQSQDAFEAALAAAKAEGNLSRANIARKLGWVPPDTKRSRHNVAPEDRGYAALNRILAKVDPAERPRWLAGARAAIQDAGE